MGCVKMMIVPRPIPTPARANAPAFHTAVEPIRLSALNPAAEHTFSGLQSDARVLLSSSISRDVPPATTADPAPTAISTQPYVRALLGVFASIGVESGGAASPCAATGVAAV